VIVVVFVASWLIVSVPSVPSVAEGRMARRHGERWSIHEAVGRCRPAAHRHRYAQFPRNSALSALCVRSSRRSLLAPRITAR